jgi:putative membrane protein
MVLNELFTRVPTLKRPFVSASDRQREVEEGALGAFFRRGINDTIDHTGILLYISLFEHKVRVVADKGISEKVDQEVWQAIVDIIISGIHEKRQGTAVAAAVDRCGQILARHFPVKPGDRNELADTIIMGTAIR